MKIKAKQIDFTGTSLDLPSLKIDGTTSERLVQTNQDGELITADFMKVDSTNQRLGIGTTTPSTKLDLVANADDGSQISLRQYNTASDGPDFNFVKARGTESAPLAVSFGDALANLNCQAYDGSSFQDSGSLVWSASDALGNSSFSLKTRSGGTLATRIQVSSDGATSVSGALSAPSLTINSEYSLPTIDGTEGQYLRTDGAGSLSFADPSVLAQEIDTIDQAELITGSQALYNNISYTIPNTVTGTIILDVPVTQRQGGSAPTPVLGAQILVHNASSASITFREYSNAASPTITLEDSSLGTVSGLGYPYASGITLTGVGTYILTCTNAVGIWSLGYYPKINAETAVVLGRGAYVQAELPLASNIGNTNTAFYLKASTYVVPSTQSTAITITLPHGDPTRSGGATQQQIINYLSGGFFSIHNRGSSTVTFALTNSYTFDGNNYYYSYLQDLTADTYKDALVVGPGEKVRLDISTSVVGSDKFYTYYQASYEDPYTVTKYVTSGDFTITPGREKKLVYILANSTNAITVTLPSPNDPSIRKDGYELVIKKTGTAQVTLQRTSYLIEGVTSYLMDNANESVTLVPVAGQGWFIASSTVANAQTPIIGMINPVDVTNTPYTHTQQSPHDLLLCEVGSATTVNLPNHSTLPKGVIISIKRMDSNSVTINPYTGGTIDGTSSLNLNSDTAVCLVLADNTAGKWVGLSVYH